MSLLPPLRWSVIRIDLDPVTGHEQGGERRCLVVSYEPFHRARLVTVCPITASRQEGRYPNEVRIPVGEAGQTKPGVILIHQVRTISLQRALDLALRAGGVQYLTNPKIRAAVREALQRHLGLNVPDIEDGARV
jgi:mRNA-degrading endonuclease toxin of MazEF toxin-antitoxin module